VEDLLERADVLLALAGHPASAGMRRRYAVSWSTSMPSARRAAGRGPH